MVQTLKPAVRARLEQTALALFAERGFAATSLAEIARGAGVSTGNVYSYFASKEELFLAVVPSALADEIATLLRGRVEAARGTVDVRALAPAAAHPSLVERLWRLVMDHRLAVGVLLVRADGSPHAGFAARQASDLVEAALGWAASVDLGRGLGVPVDALGRFALARVYRDLVHGVGEALLAHERPADARSAIGDLEAYHLQGLRALFERLARGRAEDSVQVGDRGEA